MTGNICAFNRGYQIGLWYDNGFFGRHPGERAKYPTEAAYTEALQATPDKVFDPIKQGLTIDHNLYWPAPGEFLALYGVPWRVRHEAFTRLPLFSARTGFDAHSRVAAPPFVNAAAGNYRLKLGRTAQAVAVGWGDVPANVDK